MIRPTRPPEARRARHEATGEWPQPSLSAALAQRGRTSPDRPYLIEGQRDGGRSCTFAELKARADAMAHALLGLGVCAGDVVAWQLPNWIEAPALACAIDQIGAISNPIITIYHEQEVGFVCRQARARVLVVPGLVRGVDHREIAEKVRQNAPELEHVLTVRTAPGPGMRSFEQLVAAAPTTALPPSPHGPHDVSMIFYTSGTTADPKGVLHTPSTLGAVVHFHRLMHRGTDADRGLIQFPLTHIGGVLLFIMLQAATGGSAVFMETFDPSLALDLIERHGITGAGGPPAVLRAMLDAPNFSRAKVRSVRSSGSGAADVSPELMREIEEKWGVPVYRSYGMTECPVFTSGLVEDPLHKRHGTDGRPSPGCVARLVDDYGRPVGPGVEGEIEAYGPQLCVGYLDPALNVAFTPDGYFRTGDLAVMDADGFLRITGRRKDVIIRKGENLSAKGIEDDLAAHPKVADVAVIGVPDAERGERVCACVVLRSDASTLTLNEIRSFMEGRGVMRQKIPEQVEILRELPRNATGKVKKHELRARYRG